MKDESQMWKSSEKGQLQMTKRSKYSEKIYIQVKIKMKNNDQKHCQIE